MPVLVNLPGRKAKETPFRWFRTAKQGVSRLTKSIAITAAGDNGAINAWRTDDGKWRASVMRHMRTVKEWENDTKAGLEEWLGHALEAIR